MGQLSGAKFFSKLDANSGFWQIDLSEESRKLTCFITPYGRYVFNRLPFGLSSSSEYFQKRMSQILKRLPGVLCQRDNILIFGTTEQENDERLNVVLKELQTAQLTLNAEKCEIKKRTMKFVGYIIASKGVQLIFRNSQRCRIRNHQRASVAYILRVIDQLGKFTPNLADYTKPLRDLLSQKKSVLLGTSAAKSIRSG